MYIETNAVLVDQRMKRIAMSLIIWKDIGHNCHLCSQLLAFSLRFMHLPFSDTQYSRSFFCAWVSLNTHSFIHSFISLRYISLANCCSSGISALCRASDIALMVTCCGHCSVHLTSTASIMHFTVKIPVRFISISVCSQMAPTLSFQSSSEKNEDNY